MILDGIVQSKELNTFLFSVLHLFESCRHLLLATTIGYEDTFGSQTLGGTATVHSGIATTYNHYVLCLLNGCCKFRVAGIHKVDTGQILVRGHNAVGVLARDIHEVGQACA